MLTRIHRPRKPALLKPEKARDREDYRLFFIMVGVISLLIIALWITGIYFHHVFHFPDDAGLDARGNAIGALFSGLAFVGVVAAIFLQWKEVGYQRRELRQTKKAMQQSAAAQKGQTDELSKQTADLRRQVELRHDEALRNAEVRLAESRERFITARLNATLALLQAAQARAPVLAQGKHDPRPGIVYEKEVRMLQQDIALLRCQATLVLGPAPQVSGDLEVLAIRQHLVDLFQDLHIQCLAEAALDERYIKTSALRAKQIKDDLQLLRYRCHDRYRGIEGVIDLIDGLSPD